jgi:hypothetical protein
LPGDPTTAARHLVFNRDSERGSDRATGITDGTLRLVIEQDVLPYIKGKEHPRDDQQTAGVIFLNDEGSERSAA